MNQTCPLTMNDIWQSVGQAIASNVLCNTSNTLTLYAIELLRLSTSSSRRLPSTSLSVSTLHILHSLFRQGEVKIYRRITELHLGVTSTYTTHIALSDRATYLVWDNIMGDWEYITLDDFVRFLEQIKNQINLTCPKFTLNV